MVPLFAFAFLRAEARWRHCGDGESGICFNYPAYLPYPIAQGVGIHTLAFFPAAILGQLPDSIDCCNHQRNRPQLLRYIITTLSVTVCWSLLGLWMERRLVSRCPLPKGRFVRVGMMLLLGIALLLSFGVTQAIRGGWEGPTAPYTSIFLPLLVGLLIGSELLTIPAPRHD